MNVPPVLATHACVHCGALSQTNDGKCWLCYENKSTPNPFAVSSNLVTEETPHSPMTTSDMVFGVLLAICVLLTLLIAVGLAVEDRGLLIPFAIFMGPAYAVTFFRGIVPRGAKGSPRPASLFLTFIVSLLVTVLISVVLAIAAVIMLFLACVGVFGGGW